MSDRTLPHDLDAEKSVLGAVLINNQAFNQAAEVVDAADFYRDAHRRIFEKMVGLTDRAVRWTCSHSRTSWRGPANSMKSADPRTSAR